MGDGKVWDFTVSFCLSDLTWPFYFLVNCQLWKTLIFNKHLKHNRITCINMNGQAFKYTDIRDILKKQNACVLITQELKSI